MATVYELIGGAGAMDAAVDVFYRKVLTDDRISEFFDGVDMERQAAKQKAFLTMVLGGPVAYTGKDMRAAHAHLVTRGLSDAHFDAVAISESGGFGGTDEVHDDVHPLFFDAQRGDLHEARRFHAPHAAMLGPLPGPVDLGVPEVELVGSDVMLDWRLRES